MRCLEFYSGIGGMHYAVKRSCLNIEVVCAFDINTVANDVYQFNHGRRPHQGNIQKLSSSKLDSYKADIWLLAPPCQPYTRRGLQKDADDWRASSFMQLLSKVPEMKAPPTYLLVENVVGFEQSRTRDAMQDLMQSAGYILQEFLISPTQLSIPYSRPRYFAVMKRSADGATAQFALQTQETPFNQPPSQLLQCASPSHHSSSTRNQNAAAADPQGLPSAELRNQQTAEQQPGSAMPELVRSDSNHANAHTAEAAASQRNINCNSIGAQQRHIIPATAAAVTSIKAYLEDDLAAVKLAFKAESVQQSTKAQQDKLAAYIVPSSVLHKWGNVLDIVTPASLATNCFTKTYSQYAKGCGSVLATANQDSISFDWSTRQRSSSSRDFVKPRMIARPRSLSASTDTVSAFPAGSTPDAADDVDLSAIKAEDGNDGTEDVTVRSAADHDAALLKWLTSLCLRYFTPREVANLHSFPTSFAFPEGVSIKQQYALLGNSLSIAVVSNLLMYLMT